MPVEMRLLRRILAATVLTSFISVAAQSTCRREKTICDPSCGLGITWFMSVHNMGVSPVPHAASHRCCGAKPRIRYKARCALCAYCSTLHTRSSAVHSYSIVIERKPRQVGEPERPTVAAECTRVSRSAVFVSLDVLTARRTLSISQPSLTQHTHGHTHTHTCISPKAHTRTGLVRRSSVIEGRDFPKVRVRVSTLRGYPISDSTIAALVLP